MQKRVLEYIIRTKKNYNKLLLKAAAEEYLSNNLRGETMTIAELYYKEWMEEGEGQ